MISVDDGDHDPWFMVPDDHYDCSYSGVMLIHWIISTPAWTSIRGSFPVVICALFSAPTQPCPAIAAMEITYEQPGNDF